MSEVDELHANISRALEREADLLDEIDRLRQQIVDLCAEARVAARFIEKHANPGRILPYNTGPLMRAINRAAP